MRGLELGSHLLELLLKLLGHFVFRGNKTEQKKRGVETGKAVS
jgi:hypothetical protein